MELLALLTEAESASPTHRIEWRDRIAAYGDRAIEGVRPWLSSPVLAAFAIRVIERAGSNGDAPQATQVLRSARSGMPPAVKGDLDWALQQLRQSAAQSETPTAAPPPTRSSAKPLRRERPYLSTVARGRAR